MRSEERQYASRKVSYTSSRVLRRRRSVMALATSAMSIPVLWFGTPHEPSEVGDLAVLDPDWLHPPRDLHPVRAYGKPDHLRAIAAGERRLSVRTQHVRASVPSGRDPQDPDAEPRVVSGLDRHALDPRPRDRHCVRPGEQVEVLRAVAALQAGGLARLEDIDSRAPRVHALAEGEGHDEPPQPAGQCPI